MEILKYLKDDLLIITNESYKEEILYKFKAELPSEEFIKILDAYKSCGEKI